MSQKSWRLALSFIITVQPALTHAGDVFDFSGFFKHKPPQNSAVIQLAHTLDDIEKKLNHDGTVVVKSPDIWGEARLTKHRQEFEREMAKDVDTFEFRLNAAIARTDQAFLASALAISAIGPGVTLTNGVPNNVPDLNVNQASSLLPDSVAQQTKPGEAIANPSNVVMIQTPLHGLSEAHFNTADKGINLEPELVLDQKARYLNHLHEIRRINEGDDTSDSPGYSMNLVRVPVSILPGTKTRRNHGAEVTITATPHVTEELLPVTFRQLVINDLVDLLAPVVRKLAEELPDLDKPLENQGKANQFLAKFLESEQGTLVRQYYGQQGIAKDPHALLQRLTTESQSDTDAIGLKRVVPVDIAADQAAKSQDARAIGILLQSQDLSSVLTQAVSELGQNIYAAAPHLLHTGVGSVTRRAREPMGSSQIPFAFGVHELVSLSLDFRQRTAPGQIIHLADVRSYLQEELQSAYDLVSTSGTTAYNMLHDSTFMLADGYSEGSLSAHLRNMTHQNVRFVFDNRVAVTNEFSVLKKILIRPGHELEMHLPSVTTSLAWAVIVESALLNERLNEDVRHVSMDPECGCMCPGEQLFCSPNPDPQARQVFADYVRCRWPIHVFALDPQAQDQNVADSYSMRREMQLALALAFAGGEISAQKMTRYVRRLEMDMETIALNRTAAAFGHGKDVFGWRFYPRVQTPPFESNTTTLFRDLLGGGPDKDDLRRSWEIEPGMRECTAIVLMPSFITHVTFDVRGNYFPLGRHLLKEPSDTRTSIVDNMEMSHKIRLMENATCSIAAEANCYRDGEVQRLLRRADQLAKKLPLQTVHSRVPNENTLGGFEMFSSGTTDLAPELLDFYGMPGVKTSTETVLYLVGNNFSVHDTKVLAGNREIPYDLISRQVMMVKIPAGVETVDSFRCVRKERCEQPENVVNVHIATPYGVSQPLEIPVVDADCNCNSGYRWGRENLRLKYRIEAKDDGTVKKGLLDGTKTSILMPKPFELSIEVPCGEQPHPSTASLAFVMTSRQLGLSAKALTSVNASFDAGKKAYVIEGTDFVALQNTIMARVIDWINEVERGRPKSSGPYEVVLEGKATPTGLTAVNIENPLYLNIDVEVTNP